MITSLHGTIIRKKNNFSNNSTGDGYFAALEGDLLYISSDMGDNWILKENTPTSLGLEIAISTDGTVLAVLPSQTSNSIYVSKDFGGSWNSVQISPTAVLMQSISMSSDGARITVVARRPMSELSLTITNRYSIFTSSDSGDTWNQNEAGRTETNFSKIRMSADGSIQTALISRHPSYNWAGKILVSKDFGSTWDIINLDKKGWESLSMSADGSVQIASFFADDASDDGIYISIDSGDTWIRKFPGRDAWHTAAVSNDGLKMIVGPYLEPMMMSLDLGETWSDINSGDGGWDSMTYLKDTIVVKNFEGNSLISKDNGQTWNEITQFHPTMVTSTPSLN